MMSNKNIFLLYLTLVAYFTTVSGLCVRAGFRINTTVAPLLQNGKKDR